VAEVWQVKSTAGMQDSEKGVMETYELLKGLEVWE
jgi:hypothetical protein